MAIFEGHVIADLELPRTADKILHGLLYRQYIHRWINYRVQRCNQGGRTSRCR